MASILHTFYTDRVQVYRAEEDTNINPYGGAAKLTRNPTDKPFYGRVRDKISGELQKSDTVAKTRKTCSLVCGLEADIKEGDLIVVVRGAKTGGTKEEKYLVGEGQEFREPFGGVSPQIYHKRFCLTKEEYVHESSPDIDSETDDLNDM